MTESTDMKEVTDKMSVFKVDEISRDKERANKESGSRMESSGLIGGEFALSNGEAYINHRSAVFDRLYTAQEEKMQSLPDVPITITLPDGATKEGIAMKTTPMNIAESISAGLAQNVIISKVFYTSRHDNGGELAEWEDEDDKPDMNPLDDDEEAAKENEGKELWDLSRPLVGDCKIEFIKYDPDDPDVKTVFWHSSAHVLGAAIESLYGAHLTIGPPLKGGFYYDAFMGNHHLPEDDLKKIEDSAMKVCKAKHKFQRLVLSKDEALEMFSANPFKVALITNKIPDGSMTSVYRCGPLIDLCMGPHIPNTGKIKAFAATKASATNWLGQVTNDPLQRVYGISFPDKKLMTKWKEFQEQAKQRDHRMLGAKQELIFFHNLSPGSAFWLPHGARIYNKLISFIKAEYWKRGYEEVITPNMYNLKLWEQSGHALHYKENMFTFEVEKEEFGMKPMNCPGHCLLFAHRVRSWRELPMRVADFGVLHRNELSGALSGLTRVRRFQQDDAHIFCTVEQIKAEVLGALDFMKCVYDVFGMSYKLELSTRPAKALGERELWDMAEGQLAEALNEFAGEGKWRINAGDGAFYGPKIDIKVYDAMERVHQCATVQLDFQLPIRFDLNYTAASFKNDEGKLESVYKRPVMVHRAMLGSVERMFAVLTEHWGGKWPLWLSPRQVMTIPVDPIFADYADEVTKAIHDAGFYADVDLSSKSLNKKVREAQLAQYNFILVVGQKEVDEGSVNIRTRDNEVQGTMLIKDAIAKFQKLVDEKAI